MSILLKALKKSEAQRQVGQPPDIHAAADLVDGKPVNDPQWLPLTMLAISALAIGWMVWKQYQQPESLPVLDTTETAIVESVTNPEAGEPNSAPETRTVVESLGEEINNPPAVTNFPVRKDEESETRKQVLRQSFTQYDAEPQTDKVQGKEAGDTKSPDDLASSMVELASSVETLTQTDSNSQRRASRKKADEASEPTGSEPISFWQMPQNLRDSLPELRITVLVYAEASEDRFVLINGVRMMEKEELAAGVVLDEIRRDGAIFVYRNYRFLVKG